MLVLQQYLFPAVLQCRSSSTSSTDAHYFCLSQSNFNVCKNSTMCVAGTGQIFSSAASAFASRSLSRDACAVASVSAVTTPKPTRTSLLEQEREVVRLGLPSKGRMATDTLELLKDCQLNVHQVNPRQYVADIPTLPNVEVWFQRPKDVVRKLLTGDLDLGIVGYDTVCEHGQDSDDLILVHDALEFGDCRLSIAVPKDGIFANVSSMEDLSALPLWTAERPLRIVTGYSYLGKKFAKENGLKHVEFSTADGALEASPAMGIADAILDLVSSGTTLRENNLKELQGGTVLESQGVLVASRKALVQRKEILEAAHEMLERLEAHLRASGEFTITANMRGNSAEEVAERVLNETSFPGLQGPTVCPVYCKRDGEIKVDYFAIVICVPKRQLYEAVRDLRKIAGSGVLVSPLTYIFDEEPPRWRKLADELNINS